MASPADISAPAPIREAQAATPSAKKAPDAARVAAQEFEAFFLTQVFEQMFAGISTDGPLGGGVAEGIYREMLSQEYAKVMSRSGGVGIADSVYREILKLQEVK